MSIAACWVADAFQQLTWLPHLRLMPEFGSNPRDTAMTATQPAGIRKPVPFDHAHLDRLMEAAGLDCLIATSKHNVQYLLGGYRFFFYETMDAIGITRYQNAVVYQKGHPENAAYIGAGMENFELELGRFWTPRVDLTSLSPAATMQRASDHIKQLGVIRRVGIETDFLPASGDASLRERLGNIEIADAFFPLERLRVRKSPQEIAYLRQASDHVVAAMQAAFAAATPGRTKAEVVETLRREEVARGLVFDYCLITAGTSVNRAPSDQKVVAGDIMSLDSGGNYHGYIGDLCRMGIVAASPDSELSDLLGWIEEVQQAARRVVKPGALGGEILAVGDKAVEASPHAAYSDFLAHGMGLVSHEAPRLRHLRPGLSYPGHDADRPLEPGMVLSIETTMRHPSRGFIKLEDTILVTECGYEALGDGARGWNRAGGSSA
jgi:Xaa-Pro aminopeptidase